MQRPPMKKMAAKGKMPMKKGAKGKMAEKMEDSAMKKMSKAQRMEREDGGV